MRFRIPLVLLLLLLAACNPLRRVQRNQMADSTTVDKSEIRKIVTDILHQSGSLTQTIIEYYPSAIDPPETGSDPTMLKNASATLTNPPATAQPAIKRIVKTELATQAERITTTDSTAHNDIRTQLHSELSEKVVEKPPSSVMAIKWIAIGLGAILMIIFVIKFRIR